MNAMQLLLLARTMPDSCLHGSANTHAGSYTLPSMRPGGAHRPGSQRTLRCAPCIRTISIACRQWLRAFCHCLCAVP